jgi:hypothetical protein
MPFAPARPAAPQPPAPTATVPARPGFGQRPAPAPAPAQVPALQPLPPAPRPGFAQRPAAPPRSPFAGVEQAEVMRKGSYLEEGMYVLQILNGQYKQGRSGSDMVIVECTVITRNYDPQTNPGANKEGSKVSIFIKKNDSFLGNIKALIIAAMGFDEQGNPCPLDYAVNEQECDSLVDQNQAFAGAYLAVEAVTRPTRAGGEFTNLNYFPVPLQADGTPDLNLVAFH